MAQRARWLKVLAAFGCLVVGVLVFMQLTGQGVTLRHPNSHSEGMEVHEACRQAAVALRLDVQRQIDATPDLAITSPYMVICTVELASGTVQKIGIPPVGTPVLLEPAP